MIKRLSELQIGEYATVQLVHGRGRMRTRMFDMGITPGAIVFYRKNAPMGDPIQISIRGYELTLRKCEAFNILVESNNEFSDLDNSKSETTNNNSDYCYGNKNYFGKHKRNKNGQCGNGSRGNR